ncbi:N-(5'phosphoribosyl)anthranilate isomerase (PRAI) [Lentisphaera araneosa HTCC2155]|uniref:N-(5'-phosphoribosyl)anthranilate isomerase n=1 Tax=Lentisphaera araneosa HTCC2155 TaxID=313628 RepID=A6DT87_9BACT|nr:phosphoribosylanthranilate isomerase [Lentisphaera araneosa]EDM25160.1 N-(5'phosphoribosyl)anthranilate isomerase (PRAI) [Lentisphaera araneosa HTCC2155]
MSPYIKICGISKEEHIAKLIERKTDAIGFVAYPPSPRYVTPEQVRELCKIIPANIARVLVVVNMNKEDIQAYLDAGIDTLQFHGDENAEFAKSFTCDVWRAVRLKDEAQIERELEFPCSKFVLDAAPKNASLPGGTGELGDWKLSKAFVDRSTKPVLIAGGIKLENFAEALNITEAQGLDLSSGVETSPGIKSSQKIDLFFNKLNKSNC